MRRQTEHERIVPVTRRHKWSPCSPMGTRAGRIEQCEECHVTRAVGGWYDRMGEWHTTSVPRCGEQVR